MIICPECGTINFKEGKMCRKRKEVVCIDCCKLCEHYQKDETYVRHLCMYGSTSLTDRQIKRIKTEIARLTSEQDDLYRRGRSYKADNLAWEIAGLRKDLNRLENGK